MRSGREPPPHPAVCVQSRLLAEGHGAPTGGGGCSHPLSPFPRLPFTLQQRSKISKRHPGRAPNTRKHNSPAAYKGTGGGDLEENCCGTANWAGKTVSPATNGISKARAAQGQWHFQPQVRGLIQAPGV
ncbi:hypothetical protein CB1_000350018 [Camelus ferus]|nr:hypothetical protein CB1_000350018 [Camelus ferus]